ncbi:hypothetical protein DFH07DRAFT_1066578 [Mycena maculata]|uniref:Uncharacterized protein n=1 Tax=Mycena maculata TaxID=230809 RepID=A0AAD7HTP4_9AGAR|nr:hypothetical protein DFH07DRAFT_1066578 [Mycena maculata]
MLYWHAVARGGEDESGRPHELKNNDVLFSRLRCRGIPLHLRTAALTSRAQLGIERKLADVELDADVVRVSFSRLHLNRALERRYNAGTSTNHFLVVVGALSADIDLNRLDGWLDPILDPILSAVQTAASSTGSTSSANQSSASPETDVLVEYFIKQVSTVSGVQDSDFRLPS